MSPARQPDPQPSALKTVVALVVPPAVVGVVSGLLLVALAPAFWAWQVLMVLLTVAAPRQRGALRSLAPGLVAGATYGLCTVAVLALTGRTPTVDVGTHVDLVVVTTVVGTILTVVGSALAQRGSRHQRAP